MFLKRHCILLLAWIFLALHILLMGTLLYIYGHASAVHYFNGGGSGLTDNPVPLAQLLILFQVISLAVTAGYTYYTRKHDQLINKLTLLVLLTIFMLGLLVLLYVWYIGPFGGPYGCMFMPDECGG